MTANIGEMDVEEVARGRYISENDNEHRSFTAMIGSELVDKLFPNTDPIGKTVTVRGYDFEIVGVAKADWKRAGAAAGQLHLHPGGDLVQAQRHAQR